jgi:hypothetical protein
MSVYTHHLPNAFPFVIKLTPNRTEGAVKLLLSKKREDAPAGSSFAVTVDNWDGTWNLWLSKVSFNYLNALIHDFPQPTQVGPKEE